MIFKRFNEEVCLKLWEEGKLKRGLEMNKYEVNWLLAREKNEGSTQFCPWHIWISSKFKHALNESELCFRRGPQTFIQRFQESIQQSSLQYSALFALRQSRVVLMTFQTIDLNMRTFQELDFRLITTSKSNFSEIQISRWTPYDSLSVPPISLVSPDITMHMKRLLGG